MADVLPRVVPFGGNFGRGGWKPGGGRCCASVPDGGRSPLSHQCSRKAKVERDCSVHGEARRLPFCAQHDPVAIKAKRDAERARWNARRAAELARGEAAQRLRQLQEAAVDALRQIAAGHNDARGLAQDVLARFEGGAP